MRHMMRVFPCMSGWMKPDRATRVQGSPHGSCTATETPEVSCNDGVLKLAVNGKVVSGGSECKPRKGYICLESEGSEVHFRNLRIKELPSTEDLEALWFELTREMAEQGQVVRYRAPVLTSGGNVEETSDLSL